MASSNKIQVYDTTLRDGCQSEDVSLTLEDKLEIARRLDDLGIDFIEGGWPGSNERDAAFFTDIKRVKLRHARIAAFGATRRAGIKASADRNLLLILRANTPVACVVGKTWDMHVREALRIPLQENLEILYDTIAYLKKHVDEVIFDAEHFFDGYHFNPEYAVSCLKSVEDAGVDLICLCDTNGGRMPHEVEAAVQNARQALQAPLGIHCHNDSDVAVANSVAAVRRGAVQVQGTINGFGERCGNANLVSIIASLQLKLGYSCVPADKLKMLQETSMLVYELANVAPNPRQAYVGRSAFTHKAGLHVSGIQRNVKTYEHIDPAIVGNDRRVVLSELSGRANILYKTREFGLDTELNKQQIETLLDELKRLEGIGYTFDGADASFELLVLRTLGLAADHFNFVNFRVFDDKWHEDQAPFSEAVVVLEGPDGQRTRTSAIGNGPVNALDSALRRALTPYYTNLAKMQLVDYKVRVLDNGAGTGARVRVLIESTDGSRRWGTVGVSANVVEASWQALLDSVEFKLHKDQAKARKPAVSITDYSRANGVVKDHSSSTAAKRRGESSGSIGAGNGRKPMIKEPKPGRRSRSQAGIESE
ncbi:MAG: citramalate synthase [Deltaproteobacteria bacterium]|nr:citramalate synthase [Deltaproteobacteria bacterium]